MPGLYAWPKRVSSRRAWSMGDVATLVAPSKGSTPGGPISGARAQWLPPRPVSLCPLATSSKGQQFHLGKLSRGMVLAKHKRPPGSLLGKRVRERAQAGPAPGSVPGGLPRAPKGAPRPGESAPCWPASTVLYTR